MSPQPLLQFVELGGYPDFTALFRRLGFEPTVVAQGRKAQGELKRSPPAVLVAEFNHQIEFRDRTSALESLLALAHHYPSMAVIVLYRPEQQAALDRLTGRFPDRFVALPLPVTEATLEATLADCLP